MLIGRRLNGRYKILEVIGGGGMANVYRASDIILEREVAIKILRLDFSNDEEFIRRFRREAESATSLTHPNIVNIYDVGDEDGIYYIVMEYVKGKTLKQYIQQHAPLSIEESLHIMEQLASAISHAHKNHIIHRDIKPQNILVDGSGNVKITDFGIAMALSSTTITQTNSVLGSVHYLSPEQARGGIATEKSDLYAIGIVLFELLTGRVPFDGESAVSIALKHLQVDTPPPRRWNATVPQSVENIVLKSTAKDPFHRYESADEMKADISTSLNPERMNEEKFIIPEQDDEVTKAIPIIKDEAMGNSGDTIIRTGNGSKTENKPQESKEQKVEKQKKNKKKLPLIIISTFLLLAVAIVSAFTIIPSLFFPKDVTVPDASNMSVDDAVEELEKLKFVVDEEIIKLVDENIPKGYVIKTDPKANRVVKEGANVTIYESLGKEKFEVDDYTGRNFDDVKEMLESKGYLLVTISDETFDEQSEPGTILSQSIDPGEMVVPEETTIEFEVSKGPMKIKLNDLTGYTEKAVNDYVEQESLSISIEYGFSDEVREGIVVSQSPSAGTELNKGDKITVTVSKGEEPKPPKSVPKEIQLESNPLDDGEVQEALIYIKDVNRSIDELFKTVKLENPITTVPVSLLINEGENGAIKVIVNNKVVIEETVPYPEE